MKFLKMKFVKFSYLILMFLVLSCNTSIDRMEEPLNFVFSTEEVKPCAEYPSGGYWVHMGVNSNVQNFFLKNGTNGKDGINGINGINGKDGVSVTVTTQKVEPSSAYPYGGYYLVIKDATGEGKVFIANGADGKNGLDGINGLNGKDGKDGLSATIKTELVPVSSEHPYGGYYLIMTDVTGQTKIFISNGEKGIQGIPGINGLNGINGVNGKDGASLYVKTEVVDPSDIYPYGGYFLIITDKSGESKYFVSNGATGKSGLDGINGKDGKNGKDGISLTLRTEKVSVSNDYPFGGYNLIMTDATGEHTLFISNGSNGKDGLNGLNGINGINGTNGVSVTASTELVPKSTQHPYGGYYLTVTSASGISKIFISNGADGSNGLNGINGTNGTNGTNGSSVTVRTEVVAKSTCYPYGGYNLILTDLNGEHKIFISNGKDGSNGLNGLNGATGADGAASSIATELVSPNAEHPYGGYNLIITTSAGVNKIFVANGADGKNGLNGINGTNGTSVTVKTEVVAKSTCHPTGGYNIIMTDALGVHTIFIANGADGSNGINGTDGIRSFIYVETTAPTTSCTYGGYTVITGMDNNKNGVLDESEKVKTYFCNTCDGKEEEKVAVCHGDYCGCTWVQSTIWVPKSLVDYYIKRGDSLGECKDAKVAICHREKFGGSCYYSYSTIWVYESEVAGHLAHGDCLGQCTPSCTSRLQ